ncbi:hypothetical protein ASPWEDRAFT_52045 [Aspergillus wentii DTO 134E9]|uniref:NAD(P)-binding domain-containing protein n=1 Tax=Aspergillus wentii DTO 134E9 TaxID=1073089 RepID=A0A1L9RMS4_ASPWE|nr:uncharacterized protein ASPWEDRAFT_52045 [Aspergillus wentii DTO 134E9]OJJ36231.1 hypothetical protein ASPWEDRAFT_52045 [Aspergillus wentii DTO 134E9]
MASAGLIGSTGLVGSHILNSLLASSAISHVNTFSRRLPQVESSKLTAFASKEAPQWASQIGNLPAPALFFSSFGTTRSAAGGFENQYNIEHGLHLELARAAKQAGSRIFVLISSSHANHQSSIPYARMKGEIEEDIKGLDFEKTVILRPGVVTGDRKESRPAETVARYLLGAVGRVNTSWKDSLAQDADVIAQAAINAGLRALKGDCAPGNQRVWILDGREIIEIGRR